MSNFYRDASEEFPRLKGGDGALRRPRRVQRRNETFPKAEVPAPSAERPPSVPHCRTTDDGRAGSPQRSGPASGGNFQIHTIWRFHELASWTRRLVYSIRRELHCRRHAF